MTALCEYQGGGSARRNDVQSGRIPHLAELYYSLMPDLDPAIIEALAL